MPRRDAQIPTAPPRKPPDGQPSSTWEVEAIPDPFAAGYRRFRLTIVEGPGSGMARESAGDRMTIGSHPLNEVIIDDPTVSRFHCEIRVEAGGAVVSDLNSKNGTIADGVLVREAFLHSGCLLRLGRSVAQFDLADERNKPPVSALSRFGSLVGTSLPMRRTIALLERAAASDATVLLEGETGTGKGKAAEAVHQASARRDKPFVVVDCGAIPANLLESELFGHEKGAFTGAHARRIGACEEAAGGTLFLDEIGELPTELQSKLLRLLENRQVRRVGSNRHAAVNLRVIAATNRDLRAEVNAGRFRSDLYYRLAVVKIALPPLRQRPDDIPAIAAALLSAVGASEAVARRLLSPAFVAQLKRQAWPGNVRELRNHLERALVVTDHDTPASGPATDAPALAYAAARRRALDAFERAYLEDLLSKSQGKVSRAAEIAEVDRVYLYRLLRRHGMRPPG